MGQTRFRMPAVGARPVAAADELPFNPADRAAATAADVHGRDWPVASQGRRERATGFPGRWPRNRTALPDCPRSPLDSRSVLMVLAISIIWGWRSR